MKRNAVLLALTLLVGCEGSQRTEPQKPMERSTASVDRAAREAATTARNAMNTAERSANEASLAAQQAARNAEEAANAAANRMPSTGATETPTTGKEGMVASNTAEEACDCNCEKVQAQRESGEHGSHHHHHHRAAAYPTTAATMPAPEPAPIAAPAPQPVACEETEPQSCPQPEVTVIQVRQERLEPAVAPLNRAQRREQRRAERYAAHHGVSRRADETRVQAIDSMGGE